jgi:Lon protease-like protein
LPDGRYLLEVEGTRRFRIQTESANGSYPTAHVEWLGESIGNFAVARARSLEIDQLFVAYRMCSGDGDLPGERDPPP